MYIKRLMVLLLAAVICVSLSSCFLLPKEAVIPELPSVTPYDGSDFRMREVTRGDIELIKKIPCYYQPVKEERHSFPISGEYFGNIYVEPGELVGAGTLLAEMDVSNINDQIDSCRYSINTLEIKLKEATNAYDLALESEALTGNVSTVSSDARLASKVYIEESLDIERSRLDELLDKKKQRQIYSEIDGVVTYVKNVTEGSKTIKGENIVTVTDDSSSVFVANTESYQSFEQGMQVEVLCDGVVYETTVASAEELGIPAQSRQTGKGIQRVYFAVMGSETPNASNTAGEIILHSELRENVLRVNSSAVFSTDKSSIVYLQEEDGSISVREVETGLETTRYTEIISGLEEGDCVIVS